MRQEHKTAVGTIYSEFDKQGQNLSPPRKKGQHSNFDKLNQGKYNVKAKRNLFQPYLCKFELSIAFDTSYFASDYITT